MKSTHAVRALIAHINANKNKATISLQQIADLCFITQRAAVALIKRLEEGGWIIVDRQVNKPNTYTIPMDELVRAELSQLLKGRAQ